MEIDDELIDLPELVYCKYCYENVIPEVGDGIVECTECGSGIAPLDAVTEAGSYEKWRAKIEADYASQMAAMRGSP